jgi:hypothetical protein
MNTENKTFVVRGTWTFDLDNACEEGNQEFWYERIDEENSRINGEHNGPGCKNSCIEFKKNEISGNEYITITKSGKTITWKVAHIDNIKNYEMKIEILKEEKITNNI